MDNSTNIEERDAQYYAETERQEPIRERNLIDNAFITFQKEDYHFMKTELEDFKRMVLEINEPNGLSVEQRSRWRSLLMRKLGTRIILTTEIILDTYKQLVKDKNLLIHMYNEVVIEQIETIIMNLNDEDDNSSEITMNMIQHFFTQLNIILSLILEEFSNAKELYEKNVEKDEKIANITNYP